tara:strand:+ start:2248 stop:2781 length:534 start_codon:yes stop_codon:yes gene_type:complete
MRKTELGAFSLSLIEAFPMVDDHPDVAGLLRDADILQSLGAAMSSEYVGEGITKVIAPEARGPVLGALVAKYLEAGLVLVRKDGRNHPGSDTQITSEKIWNGEQVNFQSRSFDLDRADRVLIVDDWATTGNTIRATKQCIDETEATYVGSSVIVNKAEEFTLKELRIKWLVRFDDLT